MGLEWTDIEHQVRDELATLQEALEAALPIEATNHIRGKIAALRWVLSLPSRLAPADPDTMIEPRPPLY